MNFEERFHQLTGKTPYPWQSALYHSVLNQNVPHRMGLPTGTGKTSIIPIWLSALWYQLENGLPLTVPRRLYFAVDRRVVVDQSEVVAQLVRKNAEDTPLWRLLSERTLSENPLVVSVLRGQCVLEYEDIISDPSVFAVILCTPDMVFSRLKDAQTILRHKHIKTTAEVYMDHIPDSVSRAIEARTDAIFAVRNKRQRRKSTGVLLNIAGQSKGKVSVN